MFPPILQPGFGGCVPVSGSDRARVAENLLLLQETGTANRCEAMQAVSKAVIGLGVLSLGGVAWLMPAAQRDVPPLVHVPSERLTGQYGGHDVVHALQEIVETSADIQGAERPRRPVDARAFETVLERAELSPLARVQWRRAWELAETPEARADVLSRMLDRVR
ncbi:hypothetical protein [Tropicimonas sp. S265A]|uniref:hypothetical protein n=1 Tax=Tropicimonas sp. S265A TaxID=3415134 RepID=UPI003C7B9C89